MSVRSSLILHVNLNTCLKFNAHYLPKDDLWMKSEQDWVKGRKKISSGQAMLQCLSMYILSFIRGTDG